MKKSLSSICLFTGNFLFALLLLSSTLRAQYTHPVLGTLAGTGVSGYFGDGGPATAANFNYPQGIAVNNSGDVFIADELNNRIRKVHAGIISTVAGCSSIIDSFAGDGGAATAAYLNAPFGIALDAAGNLYIADNQNFRVRKVNTSGIISTIAGNGIAGYTGDGFAATAAKIGYVQGMGIDPSGNLYISDNGNHVVRKIATSGIITTFAGTGVTGFSGDGAAATDAQFNTTRGITSDASGNIYIADNGNKRIRMVNTSGIITTVAGCSGTCPGGPATATVIGNPQAVAFDASGNMYISVDHGGGLIYKVDVAGYLTPFAGGGANDSIPFNNCDPFEYMLDGSPYGPSFMAMNNHNELFCSITGQHTVAVFTNNRPPAFAFGRNLNVTICNNVTFAHLDSILAIIDSDRNQWENWHVLAPPVNGSATISYNTPSSGDTTNPAGAFYFPATGYTGTDSIVVAVTDCIGASDTAKIHISINNCSLGLHAGQCIGSGLGITVYPNPCLGTFSCTIHSGTIQDASLVVTNVLGQQVKSVNISTNKQETIKTDLPPGVYQLSARTADGVFNSTISIR